MLTPITIAVVIYNNKGEVDLAIADYTKAIELNLNHEPIESTKKVCSSLKTDNRTQSQSCYAYNSRGIAYRQIGKLTRAIADFDN